MNNRAFIAAHRARQIARDVTADSFAPHSPATRLDLKAAQIAQVCGLPVERIEALRPKEWRWPHDWRELGGEVFYNWASLPLLVGVLATSGEKDAAAKLMHFLVPGSDSPPASHGRTAAAGNGAERVSWQKRWEDEHQ